MNTSEEQTGLDLDGIRDRFMLWRFSHTAGESSAYGQEVLEKDVPALLDELERTQRELAEARRALDLLGQYIAIQNSNDIGLRLDDLRVTWQSVQRAYFDYRLQEERTGSGA